jgi:two-component system chemotaxis sensor kinase CheA
MVGQAPVLRLRERLLPLVRLSDVLGLDRTFVDPVTGQEKPDRRRRVLDRRGPSPEEAAEAEEPERRQRSVRRDRRRKAAYEDINVVVLRAGANRFGLIVEELFNT